MSGGKRQDPHTGPQWKDTIVLRRQGQEQGESVKAGVVFLQKDEEGQVDRFGPASLQFWRLDAWVW